MLGLETLDVLIGLVTVYLVFGIACTALVEAFASWCSIRSSNLEAALNEFLDGNLKENKTFVEAFYDHPLVQALSKGKNGRPSYIPPKIVGQVVQALVTAEEAAKAIPEAVASLPDTIEDNRIKGLLHTLVTQTSGDAAAFRSAVEAHFNAVMDRSSGWFKRYTQKVALAVAAVLVIGANVDTVALATSLASSPTARAKMVEIAEQQLNYAKTTEEQAKAATAEVGIGVEEAKRQTEAARASLDQAAFAMESARLHFGWIDFPRTFAGLLAKVFGLIVSILAVSLGAPFWFDVLQRFMQVRGTGASPEGRGVK